MSSPRWRVHVAWMAVAVLVGGVAFWAGRAFTGRVADGVVTEAPAASVVAEAGEVGEVVIASGFLSFESGTQLFSGRAGVVTALSVDPQEHIASGDVVASVDLSPVVVAQGATPAFRDLAQGSRGTDVAQLQRFLGLADADGVFGTATRRAVVEWQRSLGAPNPSGSVPLGQLVFVPTLPVRAVPADDVVVGSSVQVGSALLVTRKERPMVTLGVDSAPRVRTGMPVTMQIEDGVLSGVIGPVVVVEGIGQYLVVDADGEDICDTECGLRFSAEGESEVSLQVEVSPVVSGVVVPSSAVGVQPDGSRAVRTSTGEVVAVEVVAEASGMSVVEGLDEGVEVLLFAEAT